MYKDAFKNLKLEVLIPVFFIALLFIVCGYYVFQYWHILSDPKEAQRIASSFGIWSPIILMAAEAFQVVIPYFPGQILSIIGGYLYGVWIGTIINLIGSCSGALFAFFVSRRYGRSFVKRMFKEHHLKKFDDFIAKYGLIVIFISRTQFFFPNDLISYASGLVKNLSWKKYLLVSFLGYIPHFLLLASVGEELQHNLQHNLFSKTMLIYLLVIFIMVMIYVFRLRILKLIPKKILSFFSKHKAINE